jgi:hypothetical protein
LIGLGKGHAPCWLTRDPRLVEGIQQRRRVRLSGQNAAK